jgi:GNAT superfamily N-acetyltransferase
MSIVVRPLQEGDSISELTRLLHEAYAQLAALGFNYTAVDQTEQVTRERVSAGECYVAELEGQIVGTILFCDSARSVGCDWFERPGVSSFHQFGVLPAAQRQGVGRQLLLFVEMRARETGAAEIAFDTAEGALDLIRWYRRHGYRDVGHVQWEGKTYRNVIMSKTVSRP